jgi:transcriptional regulator NrdR family protein
MSAACPKCSSPSSRVLDTFTTRSGAVNRKRECGQCHATWTSTEKPREQLEADAAAARQQSALIESLREELLKTQTAISGVLGRIPS